MCVCVCVCVAILTTKVTDCVCCTWQMQATLLCESLSHNSTRAKVTLVSDAFEVDAADSVLSEETSAQMFVLEGGRLSGRLTGVSQSSKRPQSSGRGSGTCTACVDEITLSDKGFLQARSIWRVQRRRPCSRCRSGGTSTLTSSPHSPPFALAAAAVVAALTVPLSHQGASTCG